MYILGAMIFGYLADRYSGVILLPSLFTLMGIGFIILIINSGLPMIHLLLTGIILVGLGCADLYYWLTLADHSRRESIPFVFAVGLSFHLVVIVSTGILAERFLIDTSFWFSLVGIAGSITMFLGVLFSFWVFRCFYPSIDLSLEAESKDAQRLKLEGAATPEKEPEGKGVYIEYADSIIDEMLTVKYKLTQREKELTTLLLQGYSYPQISEQLFISTNTVKYHVRNILHKINVSNRHELISVIRSQT